MKAISYIFHLKNEIQCVYMYIYTLMYIDIFIKYKNAVYFDF